MSTNQELVGSYGGKNQEEDETKRILSGYEKAKKKREKNNSRRNDIPLNSFEDHIGEEQTRNIGSGATTNLANSPIKDKLESFKLKEIDGLARTIDHEKDKEQKPSQAQYQVSMVGYKERTHSN